MNNEGRGISRCAAKLCTNNSKNSDLSFFRFPGDPESSFSMATTLREPAGALLMKPFDNVSKFTVHSHRDIELPSISCLTRARVWAINCNRYDLLQKENLHTLSFKLCGIHFEDKMFLNDMHNRLQKYAMPTRFPSYSGAAKDYIHVVDSSKIESSGESIGSRSENLSCLDAASTSKRSYIGDNSDIVSEKDIPDNLNLKFDSNEENLDTQIKFEEQYKPDISQLSDQYTIDNYCPADLDVDLSIFKKKKQKFIEDQIKSNRKYEVIDCSKIKSSGESIDSRSENLSFLDTASTSKRSFIGDNRDFGSEKDIPDNLHWKFDSNEENLDNQMKFEVEYKPDINQLSYQHNIDNYCPADLDVKPSISLIVDEQQNIQMQDETDLFFASMAKIVRKLPEKERALLRLQIGTLVSNAEIAYFSKSD